MAIIRSTWVDRVVIAKAMDGSVRGAEQHKLERVWDDGTGEILTERYLDPEPLAGETLIAALPDQAALLARVDALERELASRVADLERQLAQAGETIDKLNQALADAVREPSG